MTAIPALEKFPEKLTKFLFYPKKGDREASFIFLLKSSSHNDITIHSRFPVGKNQANEPSNYFG